MPRLAMPAPESMSAEQAEVCAEVTAGPRGKVPAPMIAWVRNAELARRGQKVGELLRFDTTLGPLLTELAILVCARHWTSHYEWTAHKALALKAGLDAETIAAIAARRVPALQGEQQQCVYAIASAMLAQGRMPDALYARGTACLGEQGVVELVSVLGYYCWVALTLNAFELGLPDSLVPEFEDSLAGKAGDPGAAT